MKNYTRLLKEAFLIAKKFINFDDEELTNF
jgi:hypothetical protein